MSQQASNAFLAILVGAFLAVLLITPVAAVMYRRNGRLGLGAVLTLVAAAVYGVALWTYTLLPLPSSNEFSCQPAQTTLFASWADVKERGVGSLGQLARNSMFMQVVLNVVLFVPFGFFVRRVLRRGFLVAGVLGFTTSLLIETTQYTGVWGVFECAYRLFDVDDLATNTLGAVVGSLLSAFVVTKDPERRPLPTHVSRGRRWTGMLLDALVTSIVAVGVNIAWRWYHLYGPGDAARLDDHLDAWIAWGAAGLLQLVVVLLAGRTIGEWAVAVRTRARRPALALPGRVVKWATGVGAFAALTAWDGPGWAYVVFLVVTVVAAWSGREHRGLSNTLGGLDLEVQGVPTSAREPVRG
ncbi:VanZ family protein [Nocardioides yefusunii]|uniref:VanZ family protein n=1 Tax=Nocardioides yefusunii TaxID=2500546 RepID=A0ABW1R3K0_9ACTN|nr:VanZ family protein [Nocardioides yefusunii]